MSLHDALNSLLQVQSDGAGKNLPWEECSYRFSMKNNSPRFFTNYNVDKELKTRFFLVHVSIQEFNEKKLLAPKTNLTGDKYVFS